MAVVVVLDFLEINEEIFATLSTLPAGGGRRLVMRKEGTAARPAPAEDEVSANGDKPSAGNEHFCGKLASSAFSSLSAARIRKRGGEEEGEKGEKERKRFEKRRE